MIPSTETVTRTKPGRPVDPSIRNAILDAALQLLAEEGYTRMSMDAVAKKAGVTKPTIYRRGKTKEKLAMAAIEQLLGDEAPPHPPPAPSALRSILGTLQKTLFRPDGMPIIGAVMVEQRHTRDLINHFRERVVQPRRMMLQEVLKHAEKRGDLRPKADIDAAVNMLIGSFYAHYLTDEKIPVTWARRIVDTVWKGIAATDGEPEIRKH